MRGVILLAAALLAATAAEARTSSVRGSVRSNGTYVSSHYRTTPNRTRLDNFSTKGNLNPYTGRRGTKDPYAPRSPRRYR